MKLSRKAAQKAAGDARRRGELVKPTHCERCHKSSAYLAMHHEDYTKPLDIAWLCRGCHTARHVELRASDPTAWPSNRRRVDIWVLPV